MNSGISKIEKDEDDLLFYGFSGSVYRCSKHGENRISAYNSGVLSHILNINKELNAKIVSYKNINDYEW